jgi:hypothetical protein
MTTTQLSQDEIAAAADIAQLLLLLEPDQASDCLRKVINVQIGRPMVAGWGLDAASDRTFALVHRIVDEIGAIGKRSATERDALGAQARQGLHW